MKLKIVSDKTARWLIIFGAIGLGIGILISMATVFNLYGKVGNCSGSCTSDNFTLQQDVLSFDVVLNYVSIVAFITGVILIILTRIKSKRIQQQPLKVNNIDRGRGERT